MLRIRGPPETVVTVHLLAGHELGQTDFPRVFGRIAVLILHAHAVDRGDAVTQLAADIDQHQVAARGVQHMLAIRGDARVQHRRVHLRVLIEPFAGQFTGVRLGCAGLVIPIDVGQEQAAVDGEHDAIAVIVCGIADDAGAALARTLAAGLLLGRHVLAVGGCAKQFARIGQLGLMVFAGLVEPA